MSGDLILEVNAQDLRTAAYEHVAYTLKVRQNFDERFFDQCECSGLDTSAWTCKYQNWTFESEYSCAKPSKFSSK